jgi:hypothetical protein
MCTAEFAGLAQEEESGKPVAVVTDAGKKPEIMDVDNLLDRLNEHGIDDQSPMVQLLIKIFEAFGEHFTEMGDLPLIGDFMKGMTPEADVKPEVKPEPEQRPHVQAVPQPAATM